MGSPPYSAINIAKWFIAYAENNEADRSNLKIQKLLYYAQGHFLGLKDSPLFSEEIQAWSHGPVVPEVYRNFKEGSADISLPKDDDFSFDMIDDDTQQFLLSVWDLYAKYGAWQLRNMTHAEPPWKENFRQNQRNIVIPHADLKRYFRHLVASGPQ